MIKTEERNQLKIAKTIEQSLNLFFRTLVYITESTASNRAFEFDKNLSSDQIRFESITKNDLLKGFNVLGNKNKKSELWQVYKGLPEVYEGKSIADQRREVARNILANNPELHYVFEMDVNGDLVFLEPYTTQVVITSFNYGFRDYLKLAKLHKKTVISEGYLSHDKARTQILTVASPIFDKNGEIKRVFAVSISAKSIKEKIFLALKDTIEGIDDGHLILIDKHGHTIASSSDGLVYSPIVNNHVDENDLGNLRDFDLLKQLKWNNDIFEKGNLWERVTKSWDIHSLEESYTGHFKIFDQDQRGTLYPISVLNNEKLWGIIVSSSANKIDRRIMSILMSAIFMWLLLTIVILSVTAKLMLRNQKLEKKHLEDQKEIELMNAQIAHDIRSPASVLKRIVEKEIITPDDQMQMHALAKRITDISNGILGLKTNTFEPECCLLSDAIQMIVDEKKIQFSRFSEVKFETLLSISPNSKALITRVDLSRILSNLLNNAFESLIDYEGLIKLEVFTNQERVHFTLTDSGVGIPMEVINALSVGGVTTKKTGSGLGLSSSRKKILELGGTFEIHSVNGKGTEIQFSLPLEKEVNKTVKTVLLDDDKFIRGSWDQAFKKQNLLIDTFEKPSEIFSRLNTFDENTVFILDTCGFSDEFHNLLNEIKKRDTFKFYIFSGYEKESFNGYNIPLDRILSKDTDLVSIARL
jgi:signal transduction histidine kinase